jgi:hypothetical protein
MAQISLILILVDFIKEPSETRALENRLLKLRQALMNLYKDIANEYRDVYEEFRKELDDPNPSE